MSNIQKIGFNTLYQSLGKIIVVIITLTLTAFLTRYLGPKYYGFYALITTFLVLATSFYDLGVSGIGSREIAKQPDLAKPILNNVLSLRFLFGIITFVLVILVSYLSYKGDQFIVLKNAIFIAAFTILINNITSSLITIYVAKLKMVYIAISEVINKIVVLVGILFAIQFNLGFLYIIAIVVLGNLIQLIFTTIFARFLFQFRFYFDQTYWKKIFNDAWPLGLFLILSTLIFHIDTIFISYLRNPEEVGLYGVAFKILEIILNFAIFFGVSVFPIISYRIQVNDRDGINRAIRRSVEFMLVFSVPVVVAIFFLSKEIIAIIAGDQFSESIPALKILALAIFFGFFNVLAGYLLTAKNKQKTALWVALIGLILNVTLNLIFIPKYGFLAAAYTTLLTQALITFLNGLFVFKFFKPQIKFRNVTQIIVVSLVFIGILSFFNPVDSMITRFMIALFGIAFYSVMLIYLNPEFRSIFNNLIRGSK
ncbi:MAG: flippase [bacterium]